MEITQKFNIETTHGLTPDSFLGDSSQRYFSSNFKHVTHHINDFNTENGVLYANFLIEWPLNWSKKKGISLQPHIGTLDFFLIATMLAENYFRKIKKIDQNLINTIWILDFYCKAGNKCMEKNRNLCECKLISETTYMKETEIKFVMAIADATVILKLVLPETTKKFQPNLRKQINYQNESYYSSGYKQAIRDITNIELCKQENSITACFELTHVNNLNYKGLGSIYMPCITFCDLILASGQLSQILLYELDNTSRENASNLWLRNIHCEYRKPIIGKTRVSVRSKKSKMVNLKGLNYNCSDLIFNFNDGDLIANCSTAYQPFIK